MANNKKRSTSVITTKVTVPSSTASSVTLNVTSGKNTFVMSAADSNFKRGAWIYDATNSELYKIKEMTSTTSGIIVGTFNDTSATLAVDIITAEDAKVKKIYLAMADAVTIIDGTNVPADYTINDEVSDDEQDVGGDFVEPFIVDAASNSSSVLAVVTKF